MMRKRLSLALAGVIALAAVPALALPVNKVLVPVIAVDPGEVIQIVVTNSDADQVRSFSTYFLPLNASGIAERTEQSKSYSVAPGQTLILEQKATTPGMLEITTNPSFSIAAQRIPFPGSRLKIEVPVVSTQNLVQANSRMHINEWSRTTSGIQSDLDLMNLSEQEMKCQAEVFEADGDQVATGALLRLKPMSVAHYADALNILGRSSINNARIELTCDRDAFAWTEISDRQNSLVTYRQPSTSSATKRGIGGGGGNDGGGGGDTEVDPNGTVLFTRPGMVAKPDPAKEMWFYNVPAEANKVYRRLEVEFDMFNGGPSPNPGGNVMSLFWVNRGFVDEATDKWSPWNSNVVAFANDIIGKNQIKFLTNLDEGSARNAFVGSSTMQPGNWYHVKYVRDTPSGENTITITDRDTGATVGHVRGSTRNKQLRTDSSGFYYIEFGHHGPPYYGPERESYGWEWRDLSFKLIP